jgi:hypothetical protein
VVQFKRARPSGAISNFRQVAPQPGAIFGILAEAANKAADTMLPYAKQVHAAEREEYGRQFARDQMAGGQSVPTGSGDDIDAFNASLARTESGGDYSVVNKQGYSGKYQWGQARLDDYNRATGSNVVMTEFLADPEIQERAQRWHVSDIDQNLGKYVGTVVKGTKLSINAIRAMAHLGGIGGARKFIESGGAFDPADANGTRLSKYAEIHGGAGDDELKGGLSIKPGQSDTMEGEAVAAATMKALAGQPSAPPPPPQRPWEPTLIRTAQGRLEPRMYSPLSDPILQMGNAAASMGYVSEIMNKGSADLIGLSAQFPLDPKGFQQAASSYVDSIVQAAPSAFRSDLRSSLEKEMSRRHLGMVEEKHNDTMKRAANETRALTDRWSGNYAEALASGNAQDAAEAEAQLRQLLRAQEALPGLAWTPAQSENVILAAQAQAAAIGKSRDKERVAQAKESLALITKAATEGRFAADESILMDPSIAALLPEEYAKAAGVVALRDGLPGLHQLPPAVQQRLVDQFLQEPAALKADIDIGTAAQDIVKANKAAWEKDPIRRAKEVLVNKPPPLPDFSGDPAAIQAALAARADYANALREQGYFAGPAFIDDSEAEFLGTIFSKNNDPALRAVMAGYIVSGFGPDAGHVFKAIKSDDEVTMLSGQMMAAGGEQSTAVMAMAGQQMIDQSLVQLPPKATAVAAFSTDIAEAMAVAGVDIPSQGGILKLATALYASQARGVEPSSEAAKTLMAKSMQMALGQSTDRKGELRGGVQKVGGYQTLLPPGVSGKEAERALGMAITNRPRTQVEMLGAISVPFMAPFQRLEVINDGFWAKMGSTPQVDASYFARDMVRIVPVSGTTYTLRVEAGESFDVLGDDGLPFVFDINKLIEAGR